jgi:putative protein kinase ArgK-like GTPase of G3E family
LANAIWKHREYLEGSNILEKRNQERLFTEFDHFLRQRLIERWYQHHSKHEIEKTLERIYQRQVSPRQAVEELL